jgi:hypothetical protein
MLQESKYMEKRRMLSKITLPSRAAVAIVEQHDVCRFTCNLGAAPAHRDTDVGLRQGGSVS